MDTVALHERDATDLRDARAVITNLEVKCQRLERIAIAALNSLDAIAPGVGADLKEKLGLCATA
jgi:hypothetical protein